MIDNTERNETTRVPYSKGMVLCPQLQYQYKRSRLTLSKFIHSSLFCFILSWIGNRRRFNAVLSRIRIPLRSLTSPHHLRDLSVTYMSPPFAIRNTYIYSQTHFLDNADSPSTPKHHQHTTILPGTFLGIQFLPMLQIVAHSCYIEKVELTLREVNFNFASRGQP